VSGARRRAILVAAHRTRDDAIADLIGYEQMYPRRRFAIELRDDRRERPWQIMLTLGRCGWSRRWRVARRLRPARSLLRRPAAGADQAAAG
jgi:hypothetical protein